MEKIALIVSTTGSRPEQLARCLASHHKAAEICGIDIIERIFLDRNPANPNLRKSTGPGGAPWVMAHLVETRNRALNLVDERWAFLCDDDDFVLQNHVNVLQGSRVNNPLATVLMGQCQDANKKPLGFTLSCCLINVDRFRMVGWMCPPDGGEDFYTLSTLAVRGHIIVKEPAITWQVNNDIPSLTRPKRVELQSLCFHCGLNAERCTCMGGPYDK